MPLRRLLTGRLRRRRAEADLIWQLATRHRGDMERIRREAFLSQEQARDEAFRRIAKRGRYQP